MKLLLSLVLAAFAVTHVGSQVTDPAPAPAPEPAPEPVPQSLLTSVTATLTASVTQTFYIPLPETQLFTNCFQNISDQAGIQVQGSNDPPDESVVTIFSITVSSDGTIIFYDHHEDGFESDLSHPNQASTELWGNKNAADGCAPSVPVGQCTDANDYLSAGTAIIVKNTVPFPRTDTSPHYLYDGGDKVGSSLAVAMVRAAYPLYPGSMMAGSLEMLDYSQWGMEFETPVGTDVVSPVQQYSYSTVWIMAGNDNTNVTYQVDAAGNTLTVTLNEGETTFFSVEQAWTINASFPVQAVLLTGAAPSNFQLRWFSLLPVNSWSSDYLSPVGDTVGRTKVYCYNPGDTDIDVNVAVAGNPNGYTITVPSKKGINTQFIPDGSACRLSSDYKFLALSSTDTEVKNSKGVVTQGALYDWGFPVMPYSMLTTQVLIGLGWACTDDNCTCTGTTCNLYSGVWVAPAANADIYVDSNNDGVYESKYTVNYLKNVFLSAKDLSGAIIFATEQGSGPLGNPVKIAAAWGQNPGKLIYTAISKSDARYKDEQAKSMDFGTCVTPFPTYRVTKNSYLLMDNDGDGLMSPGDVILYEIVLTNVGQVDIASGTLTIIDDQFDTTNMVYVTGSTSYGIKIDDTNWNPAVIPDDTSPGSSPFPLDEAGQSNMEAITKRGGVHRFTFAATIKHRSQLTVLCLQNAGMAQLGSDDLPSSFEVTDCLNFPPTPAPTMAPTDPTHYAPGTHGCPYKNTKKVLQPLTYSTPVDQTLVDPEFVLK